MSRKLSPSSPSPHAIAGGTGRQTIDGCLQRRRRQGARCAGSLESAQSIANRGAKRQRRKPQAGLGEPQGKARPVKKPTEICALFAKRRRSYGRASIAPLNQARRDRRLFTKVLTRPASWGGRLRCPGRRILQAASGRIDLRISRTMTACPHLGGRGGVFCNVVADHCARSPTHQAWLAAGARLR
jgi:hypothetical protein